MNRTIITVVGKDTVGIIAKVCTYLAENSINILDISQTIVQEYFNMMMIVDMGKMQKTFEEVADELTNVGKAMGVQIKCQREENPHEDVLQKAIRPIPVTDQPGAALKSVKRPADEQEDVRASHRSSFQNKK